MVFIYICFTTYRRIHELTHGCRALVIDMPAQTSMKAELPAKSWEPFFLGFASRFLETNLGAGREPRRKKCLNHYIRRRMVGNCSLLTVYRRNPSFLTIHTIRLIFLLRYLRVIITSPLYAEYGRTLYTLLYKKTHSTQTFTFAPNNTLFLSKSRNRHLFALVYSFQS
jgi:hypothetical protein